MLLSVIKGGDYRNVGLVSYFAAREINSNSAVMSWYPNISSRFHEVDVSLPRDQFTTCIHSWRWQKDPVIFVKNEWIENLHLRCYSIFALVDAIGVKAALESGSITREKLVLLRSQIDLLSKDYPEIAFVSFADSLIVKGSWTAGYYKSEVKYDYEPELFIHIVSKLNDIYQDVLGLETYAVLTQGQNEYYDDSQLHISASGNHISLNSLGVPFAQLTSIESEARCAKKENIHEPAELYMDEVFYRSLNLSHEYKEQKLLFKNTYQSKMLATSSNYYYDSREHIIRNLVES